jgi:hypothetical protein
MNKTTPNLIVALTMLVFLAAKPFYAQDYMRISLTDGTEMDIAISDIQKLTFDLSVGLQQQPEIIQQLLKLKLYPNPAKDSFTLDYTLSEDGRVVIEVFTLTGKRINVIEPGHQQSGNHHYKMSTQHLSAGTYLIRVQQNNRFVVEKILVKP